jgi:hypothetical protein
MLHLAVVTVPRSQDSRIVVLTAQDEDGWQGLLHKLVHQPHFAPQFKTTSWKHIMRWSLHLSILPHLLCAVQLCLAQKLQPHKRDGDVPASQFRDDIVFVRV